MHPESLLSSSKYKRFIADRDRALERIHQNTQMDLSRQLHQALEHVEASVALVLLQFQNSRNHMSIAMEQKTLEIFTPLVYSMTSRIQNMRRAVFTLANLSELEAIGQATQKTLANTGLDYSGFDYKQKLLDIERSPMLLGEDVSDRVWASLMSVRERILRAFRMGVILKEKPEDILNRVTQTFPDVKAYDRAPRALKPLREASFKFDLNGPKEISTDFVDEGDWDLAVDAYKDSELPPSRFDNQAQYNSETGYMTYNWELEQSLTDDFVKQVRDGQVDAANELGIEEFVWVAIIDQRTDECCLLRNGLTTSEIEKGMKDGSIDVDLCDAISPPAHPNCRCQLAPVASKDEVEGPDWKSFNDWLNS